jgi:PII-like signaling protein
VNDDCLKLTTYFGERDRAGGGFLADALMDCDARHEFQTSLILRGIEGFGAKHHLRTDRLPSLSEDLPLISVAVDTRERIQAAVPEVGERSGERLITLERALMLTGRFGAVALPEELEEATKLSVYVGRGDRIGMRVAHVAVVELLHGHEVPGATVLLGVDGTAHGTQRRGRFFGAKRRSRS